MFAVTKIQIFESNSQPVVYIQQKIKDVRRHKDTNFWKQFTTGAVNGSIDSLMFAVTKIQIFESNSQLRLLFKNRSSWCSPSQRYKFLKAIHNEITVVQRAVKMFAVTKIQIFESNSQHAAREYLPLPGCSPSQRYKFLKAIHNTAWETVKTWVDVRRHKDTNFWKQFTTW